MRESLDVLLPLLLQRFHCLGDLMSMVEELHRLLKPNGNQDARYNDHLADIL
ncbi:MAG TPA: hypothetical protein VN682_15540 [Terriglobales bacterium]|nr:hypothetical protein [Terriglobales bacterium]